MVFITFKSRVLHSYLSLILFSACESTEALIEQIPDASLTASSVWRNEADHGTQRSRFTTVEDANGRGAWASWQVDTNQWIQAEFSAVRTIHKVATKGRNQYSQWVTKYQLKYALWSNEQDFVYVTSSANGGDVMTFNANTDRDSVVENEFAVISVRFLRLCPVEWFAHISLRWEVYGC